MDNNKLYAVIDCTQLQEWIGVDCMPICEFDEITYENIKSELSDTLGAEYLDRVDYVSEDDYIYARGNGFSIGVSGIFGDSHKIYVQYSGTKEDVVIKSLQSLVSKFPPPLVCLPEPGNL